MRVNWQSRNVRRKRRPTTKRRFLSNRKELLNRLRENEQTFTKAVEGNA